LEVGPTHRAALEPHPFQPREAHVAQVEPASHERDVFEMSAREDGARQSRAIESDAMKLCFVQVDVRGIRVPHDHVPESRTREDELVHPNFRQDHIAHREPSRISRRQIDAADGEFFDLIVDESVG
jgi:hypothetical protein